MTNVPHHILTRGEVKYLLLLFFVCLFSLPLKATTNRVGENLPSDKTHMQGNSPRQDSVVAEALRQMQCVPFYDGNTIDLLPSGRAKYEALFADVSQARHYVHLEYFKFFNDSIGGRLIHLLHEKVREGVEVRILIDGFGNKGNATRKHTFDAHALDSVRSLGIQIDIFKPIRLHRLYRFFHRDHRKIVVIDGRVAYVGGMNIADYYIHGKPQVGSWNDMHVRLEGPVAEGLQAIFSRMWCDQTGEYLDSLVYRPKSRTPQAHYRKSVGKRMALVNRMPFAYGKQMRWTICHAIDAARDSICIVNPYLTNTWHVRKAMYRALKRGVKLKIMVSAKSDIAVTPDVIAIEMHRLMKHGAEVYYYEDGFHHDKFMTVDGQFCTIGTTNLDGRSLRFDHEVNIVVFDPTTTHSLESYMQSELQHSTLLTPSNWKKRFSLSHRIIGRMAGAIRLFF